MFKAWRARIQRFHDDMGQVASPADVAQSRKGDTWGTTEAHNLTGEVPSEATGYTMAEVEAMLSSIPDRKFGRDEGNNGVW